MINFGLIAAVLSPFFSSIATVFKSGAAKELTPLFVVSIGGIIGSILLFAIAKLLKEKISFEKIKNCWKELSSLIILRFILGELFLTIGLSQTSAVKAIFFTKIEPYFVLLIAWIFLKERIRRKHFVFLTIHLVGALILSTGGNLKFLNQIHVGDLLIILSMGFFASSYTFGAKLSHNLGAITSNALSMGIASLILLPIMLLYLPIPLHNTQGLVYLFVYVFLFNVIALTLWFASLKTVKGWMVSALRYIGPALGAPVAYILFKETLSFTQIIGAGIILTTSFLITREHIQMTEASK